MKISGIEFLAHDRWAFWNSLAAVIRRERRRGKDILGMKIVKVPQIPNTIGVITIIIIGVIIIIIVAIIKIL